MRKIPIAEATFGELEAESANNAVRQSAISRFFGAYLFFDAKTESLYVSLNAGTDALRTYSD